MNILSNSYKKYIAAVATAFAAIAIPAQATDCTTFCQNAAATAAQNAVNQALPSVTAQCASYDYNKMSNCIGTTLTNIGNTTYQQALAQCNGSCH